MMLAGVLGSFVPGRGGLYRGTWRFQYHVLRITHVASHGGFHTKASLEAGQVLGTGSNNDLNSKKTSGTPNKCFMITSSTPDVTKHRHVLDQLSKLLSKQFIDAKQSRNPAIVILATPTFTTWLGNVAFMREVLETIFLSRSAIQEEPILEVTALVAVVDGLPRGEHGEVEQATEGFAFLACDRQVALAGLWGHDERNLNEYQSNVPRSSIKFKISSDSSTEGVLDIAVPLANTMFRNGRAYTLSASKWQRSGSNDRFKRTQQVEKTSVTIYPASSSSITPIHLEIPVVPLTPLRQVVSGLGNILRQIANADGNAVPASQELEASLDSYLETRPSDKQAMTVWALVIPNSTFMDGTNESVIVDDPKQIRDLWTNTQDSRMRSYVGHWLQRGRGATLHRVLSGGGGWGLKQGLLSLDPDISLSMSASISQNCSSSNSLDDDQIQALGNIAKPGSWVQFLTSQNIPLSRLTDAVNLGTKGSEFESATNLYFGCIASTVDDIPQPLSNLSTSSDGKDTQVSTKGYRGQFGAMSEAGIFIRAIEDRVVTSSKIDVPNSEIRLTLIDWEEPQSREK